MLLMHTANAAIHHDTMRVVKSLIKEGQFKKAEKLLQALHQSHPDDLNTIWLYAQTAYWAKHYKTFNAVYIEAMQKFPANYYLKLDYALKLVENGDIKKALPILELYKAYDSTSNDLKLALAKINYWQGNFNNAFNITENSSFNKWKNKPIVTDLKNEILSAKSPWVKLNTTLVADDQPMQTLTPTVEAGTYINPICSPSVLITAPFFIQNAKTAKAISFGNKFNFFSAGLTVNVNAGFMHLPGNTNTFTGSIDITQTSFKHLQLAAQISHQPYLTTLSSLENKIVPTQYALSAGWNNLHSWNGKFVSSVNHFGRDTNFVYNIGGWIFAPPLKFSSLTMRIGYSYAYSSSNKDHYLSKLPLADVITNNYSGITNVEGIYSPYFTPNHQQVHAALLNLTYNPNQQISFGINASIGFAGSTKNPYLFLDTSTIDPIINTGYSTVKFYPDEIASFLLYKLSVKTSLKVDYTFMRNNFYTNHKAGITLLTSFWNEKKKK